MSVTAPAPAADRPVPQGLPRVLLAGNPNTGKTTVFNRLCGVRAKTANFPGTTATMRIGRAELDDGRPLQIVDLPGLYRLDVDTEEARTAREMLEAASARDAVVVIVDAANLARNLVLVGELLSRRARVVVCLNMTDIALRRGAPVDAVKLAVALGVPVVPTVASRGIGLPALKAALGALFDGDPAGDAAAAAAVPPSGAPLTAYVAWADGMATEAADGHTVPLADRATDRLDRVVTHPVAGTAIFFAVMGGLFWALFALATVPMDLIDVTFAGLGTLVRQTLPDGPVRDLITDGVIGGIAGTVVFLPQIMLLFFLISLLEDTGYLARAAFVNDRFFRRFGLPGHAFVPLLTSHACAIPGLMSTRLIPNRRDRLATILVLPFMSCSARLPVYVLLTSLLFAGRPGWAGVAFAGAYVLGAAAAFGTAALFGRTYLRGRPQPMMLELPSYRWPSLVNALFTARDQGLSFLKTAGTIIFAICVVMWWLSAYPRSAPPPEAEALRAQAAAVGLPPPEAQALVDQADRIEGRALQANSFAGRFGRLVQPVFAPLGYDWQLTDALLTSFLAREVFVSTMAVLSGRGDTAEPDQRVIASVRTMTRDDGAPVFTRATAASALVFFVLAMQCLATLTVTRREAGGLRYAAVQLFYMSGLAYVAALVVYQGLRAFGIE